MRTKKNTTQNTTVTIKTPWRVRSVFPKEGYTFKVIFIDGTSGVVDMTNQVQQDGVFLKLQDKAHFDEMYVELGVVTWPGEIDLAPDAMYEAISKNGIWKI